MPNLLKHLTAVLIFLPAIASAQFFNDFDQPPHHYWTAEAHDPMSKLLRKVESGAMELNERPGLPLLKRLLKELDIPIASQVLVFSRTSLQRGAVSPTNPRAIYFNEETYLGWMPGGRIEIASSDPKLGAIFYFQREFDDRKKPLFFREKVCIQCHAGSATNFMPGLLGRSVFPDGKGRSLKSVETFERVGHEVPLRERWGGWYVSGGHDSLQHMGNRFAKRGVAGVGLEAAKSTPADLGKFFDTSKYPLPTSDVAALLVLDHQISMHFELMEAQYIARQALADAGLDPTVLPDRLPKEPAKAINEAAERVVGYLLFQNEADLGDTPIEGGKAFREMFLASRKKDSKGLSLRDLRLKGRLFEQRCSFMIYSESFRGLSAPLKVAVFHRLREILSAETAPHGYGHLGDAERKAIRDILIETLPGFADAASTVLP